jgi:hypothetical protein
LDKINIAKEGFNDFFDFLKQYNLLKEEYLKVEKP